MIQVGELIDESLWFIFGKSDVLNITPWTHDIPHINHGSPPIYWTSPDVPHMNHDIPPMY